MCFREKEVDLSVNDWLDGIQKTVRSSIQEAKDRESQGALFDSFFYIWPFCFTSCLYLKGKLGIADVMKWAK